MKVGILGGTFDPVHLGHLAVAEEARERLNLAVVLFVPTGQPWMKKGNLITPAEHRVEMLRLAIADNPYFKLSTIEIERGGPTYTVDTITELKKQYDADDELFFILGWGSMVNMPKWHEPSRLVQMCRLVGVPRPGYSAPDLGSLEAVIPGITKRVILLDKPLIDISASAIRERVAGSQPISDLVPDIVSGYIKKHRLYIKEKEGA